jgi:hypothetical protein
LRDPVTPTRQYCCHAGADWAFAGHERAVTGNHRGIANLNTGQIRNRIMLAGCAGQIKTQITCAF